MPIFNIFEQNYENGCQQISHKISQKSEKFAEFQLAKQILKASTTVNILFKFEHDLSENSPNDTENSSIMPKYKKRMKNNEKFKKEYFLQKDIYKMNKLIQKLSTFRKDN